MKFTSKIELEKFSGEFRQARRRGVLKEIGVKEFGKRVGIKRSGILKHFSNLL